MIPKVEKANQEIVVDDYDGPVMTGTHIPRTRKKVAIVGFAPSSMTDVRAFFGDPDWEIWGLNQLYVVFPEMMNQATRWFQIHHRTSYNASLRDHDHHAKLAEMKFPVYMQVVDPDIPNSVEIPKNKILNKFGDYFTNSISWMLAVAIMEGFEKIAIFGVDMAQDTEYSEQRPSCEWLIGWARGAGIDVHIPQQSDLMKTMWLYPYEDNKPFRQKIEKRIEELTLRCTELDGQEKYYRDIRMQKLGERTVIEGIIASWELDDTGKEDCIKKLNQLQADCGSLDQQEKAARDQRMQLLGARENMGYILMTWDQSGREQAGDKSKERMDEVHTQMEGDLNDKKNQA